MGKVISAGFVGTPHPHLMQRPPDIDETHYTPLSDKGAQVPHYTTPQLWEELHRRALRVDQDDSNWIARFSRRVPCGDCKVHWLDMLHRTPPDWPNYFAWTVARHNEVNQRLGKPVMAELEARRLWA